MVRLVFFGLVIKNFVDMVDRERTYITSFEKTLQANISSEENNSHLDEKHYLGEYNSMFFVVKNYSNIHQPMDLLNKYLYFRVRLSQYIYDSEGKR